MAHSPAVAMANAKGRLAEAYTCGSSCTPKKSDGGYSYTSRGERSDIYESTPNSGGYFHVSETYYANGAVNTVGGLTGMPTITYGIDGEGRTNTVSASSGTNPVLGTTYSPYATPPTTLVNFGSGDSDQFTYDAKTGRMTQYKFNVGGSSEVGNLTWNTLGTLGSLGITDPFNTQDAQNCAYTHDDLGRIATDTCAGGAGWTQNFSYDAFGNITKSQSGAFAPNYTQNPPTNQITTVGGTAAHYDANGNVLTDTVQNYTWDADGHPVTIGNVNQTSVGAAYDALGDVVEQTRGSAYTQVVYAPDGTKLALMNGTGTLVKSFVPLTGGATAVYTPSVTTGPTYYRHADWLGTSRLTSTASRTVYSDAAYAPFGETYAQSGTADASFTGMNQDTVPTVDDFPAREYGSLSGRWASPDPLGVGAVDPTDPQSWNRYAYVRNSPLTITDPDGRDYLVCIGGEYASEFVPLDCQTYGGDTVDALTAELAPAGLYPAPGIGDNDGGGINSVQAQAEVGEYWHEGGGVTVNGNDPSPPPIGCQDTLSGCGSQPGDPGTQPGTSPGDPGGGGSQMTLQQYLKCVSDSGNEASVQAFLQYATHGHLGKGPLAGALLGNPISDLIDFFTHRGSGGTAVADVVASKAPDALRKVPNVTVSAAGAVVRATPSEVTVILARAEAVLPLKALGTAGADFLEGLANSLTIPVDVTASSFGAVTCAAGG